ncbi:DALR anticodon-binding domain-containing protein [Brevibacterium sp.]|uniref:DALR anticodon-binding domain-containing protein n=1 Tax=Brevibacterium sp. TaxID=1701 RepID=UPI002810FF62|nr:DALR anticodon-binding domain-containing protein [Brevibacterium sp.]
MTPELLQTALSRALSTARGGVVDLPSTVTLTRPRNSGDWDWTSNIALQTAGLVGVEAHELASTIAKALRADPGIAAVDVTGPGFLAITLDASSSRLAAEIVAEGDDYGRVDPAPETVDPAPESVDPAPETVDPAPEPTAGAPGVAESEIDSVRCAYARAVRIDRVASAAGVGTAAEVDPEAAAAGVEGRTSAESALLTALADFPRAAAQGPPSRLLRHLGEVAETFHRWADAHPVTPTVDEEITAVHAARLTLDRAAAVVLKNGLRQLGEPAPERM